MRSIIRDFDRIFGQSLLSRVHNRLEECQTSLYPVSNERVKFICITLYNYVVSKCVDRFRLTPHFDSLTTPYTDCNK